LRKLTFWILFIIGTIASVVIIVLDYQKYKIRDPVTNKPKKPVSFYIIKFCILMVCVFAVSWITGFLREVFGTMNLKQAVLMCKKYGFKEKTPEFSKCLLDEQRAREMRQMIAANNRQNYY